MRNLEQALLEFERLYEGTHGYALSHRGRERLKRAQDRSLTYGEVTPRSFAELLAAAQPLPHEVFCDLGCGTGKPVVIAALAFHLRCARGVELVSELVEGARSVKSAYESLPRRPGEERTPIEFVEGDLLEEDLSAIDIVFAHSEVFGPALNEKLVERLKTLKPGARVLNIGVPYEAPHLELHSYRVCEMDWGVAAATLYQRAPT